ncbi:MAG TPA: FtsH protease activity modulator HflK [Rhizomicrobium sp.]|nr:FtsH protease activity modulator HflK [Rhizomicrobium sp.]
MPWNNPQSGNGGNRGPWGRGPSGGGGPPDLPDLIRRGQDRLRGMFPGGAFSSGGLLILLLAAVVVWLLSGVYFVSPDEQGVVLRFGRFVATTSPGMNYHLPWPVETVMTPKVTRENQINIGYRTATDEGGETGEIPEESLMLTGDENIVDVNFSVFWVIKDAGNYLFNVDNPQGAVKAVAESAMREVVGQNEIEAILTQDRGPIQVAVRELMQKTLDAYGAGVTITRVQMLKVDPPEQVIGAYRDVQAARADQETMRNQAEAYANKIIPEARGRAAKIVQDAEAYKQQAIAEASGEAGRFTSVYDAYKKSPDVTRRRMYLETMSQILGEMNKIVIDEHAGHGVVPYLPLPGLQPNADSDVSVTTGPVTPVQPAQSAKSAGGGQ